MTRHRANFLTGTTADDPLALDATVFNSPSLISMPVVADPDILAVTFDPEGLIGPPEIVWVTAHASGATVATILREQEGTIKREHPLDTVWVNAMTALDVNQLYADIDAMEAALAGYVPLSGGILTGPLVLAGSPADDFEAATKEYVDGLVGTGDFLPLSGGTLTGPLTLFGAPTASLHAATKAYADTKAASSHNHSGVYAPDSHTHAYAPTSHTHAYAPTSHSHSYAPLTAISSHQGTNREIRVSGSGPSGGGDGDLWLQI